MYIEEGGDQSAPAKDIFKKLMDDDTLQKAFYAIVTRLAVDSNTHPRKAGRGLVQLAPALPEGAGIEVPEGVSKERAEQLSMMIEDWANSQGFEKSPFIDGIKQGQQLQFGF